MKPGKSKINIAVIKWGGRDLDSGLNGNFPKPIIKDTTKVVGDPDLKKLVVGIKRHSYNLHGPAIMN